MTKRRSAREGNYIVQSNASNVQTEVSLYECPENEAQTIYRIVGNMTTTRNGSGNAEYQMAIVRIPDGGSAPNLTDTNGADLVDKLQGQVLWYAAGQHNASGVETSYHAVDVEGMRKMTEGDTIQLVVQAHDAPVKFVGGLTVFYKV